MLDSFLIFLKNVFHSNIRYYLFAYLSIFTFSFIKVPFLTSIFTPEQLGVYAYYGSILSYIDIIFLSWMSSTAWRYIYDKNEVQSTSQLVSALLPLITLLIVISFICLSFILFFFKQHRTFSELLFTGYFTIVTQQLISIFLLYLQSKNITNKWSALITNQNLLSMVTLLFLIIVLKKGIVSIYLSSFIVNTSLLLWLGIKYRYKLKLLVYSVDTKLYKKVFSYSFLIILSGICLMILNNADRFIIDHYKGKSSVGLYSQTYNLASVGFYSAIQVFTTILLPIYNKNLASNSDIPINRNIIQLYIIVFTPLLFFCILHSSIITQLFLGERFQGYNNIFRLVLLSIYCFGFSNFFDIRLKFHNKIKLATLVFILTALFNIALNIIFLKHYSIEFAAIISFISYFLLTFILILLNLRFFISIEIGRILIKLVYASCLFYIICYFSKEIFHPFNNFFQLIIYSLSCLLIYAYFLKEYIFIVKNSFKKAM